MHENIDGALSSLAQEINALEADRKAGNASKMIALGHKLLAVREILRERNGSSAFGLDAAGLRSPNGWGEWVRENLTIHRAHASRCIQYAVDPNFMTTMNRRGSDRNTSSGVDALSRLKHWSSFTDENKCRIYTFVTERYYEECNR